MDNQRLKGLITGWRSTSRGLTDGKDRPELSNSESWLAASILDQCARELEVLVFIDEEYTGHT